MGRHETEQLLLELAIGRGMITASEIPPHTGDLKRTLDSASLRWGPRLDALVQSGRLSPATLEQLASDVAGCQFEKTPYSGAANSEKQALAVDRTAAGPAMPQPPSAVAAFPVPNWDRYQFLSLLGRGGMGAIYKARDRRLGRIVALKFIHGDDPVQIHRFLQEACAQAKLDHPNICKVYETGEIEGKPYIAMELIDGLPLDKAQENLSLTDKVRVVKEAAEAMHAAHSQGVIHRDIKPSNILVETSGRHSADSLTEGRWRPVVMDFGLARDNTGARGLTESGAVLGTPAYMSPEQARGEAKRLDHRTDVYSLGATLYDLLVGAPPFSDETVVNVIMKVMNEDPVPPRLRKAGIPGALDTIVCKCLNKEPGQRYATALALAEDLGRFLDSRRIVATRLSLSYRISYWARRRKGLAALGVALAVSLLSLTGYGVYTRLETLRREREAKLEAELAQRLGQEITAMEWMLRSARQLPLHDLGKEKAVIRQRIQELSTELTGYGQRGRGLGHYAIGRGHMALHEYPQALEHLQMAMSAGNQRPEVHYALGIVLGKHFEQAVYEARMSGGGDWTKKQLKELEPKYLFPALASLEKSQGMKQQSTAYRQALTAYYKRDYDQALRQADAALGETAWLYEAAQLAGDVHHERALAARDSGQYEAAETEFAAAVKRYEAAAEIGRSDPQVYEGLAEAWLRQVEMNTRRSRPFAVAHAAANAASDKIVLADPENVAGPLKKAFIAEMAIGVLTSTSQVSDERAGFIKTCLANAEAALQKQPGHPYVSDIAAICHYTAARQAQSAGGDPVPHWRMAQSLLGTALKNFPRFLWGLNDLGIIYMHEGYYLRLHGNPSAKQALGMALEQYTAAAALDPTYINATANALVALDSLVWEARTDDEVQSLLTRAEDWFSRCTSINGKEQHCFNNLLEVYASAAQRTLLAGADPRPRLGRALEIIAKARKLAPMLSGDENTAALAHLVEAGDRVRQNLDPAPALSAMQEDLARCAIDAPGSVHCQTLAAQLEWVTADWLALQKQPFLPVLHSALGKAVMATQNREQIPDAWWTLAATYLRLANALNANPAAQAHHISDGLVAAKRIFAINPNHGLGRTTQGALHLLRAQSLRDPIARLAAAQAAAAALDQALKNDPFLNHSYAALLSQARELAATQ